MLTLFEELLMLSIHEDKGTFIGWTVDRIKPGLAGAVLTELAFAGKITVTDNHRLKVVNSDPVEDDVLNEALAVLAQSEKERKFTYWINALTQKPEKPHKQITDRLIEKGIISMEDDHLVWTVPTPLDPAINATSKFCVNNRLRGIVLAQETDDQRDIALLSLVRACNLLDLIFLKEERRYASRQINELVLSAAMKEPLAQTIQEIENAIALVAEDD